MLIKNEKQLLGFVRYSPIVVIVIIAILVNFLIYNQNEKNYKKDLDFYAKNFIEVNKNLSKLQVEKVYKEIQGYEKSLEKELKEDLKNRTIEAYTIINSIYKNHINEGKDRVLTLIKNALRDIRFNKGQGYFYIYSIKGKNILHPIKPELEGKLLLNYKDKKNTYITRDIVKELLLGKTEIFKELYWVKPNDLENTYRKITFNKYHKELGIFIGTGEYIDNFSKKLKKRVLDYIYKISYGKNGYVFVFDYDGVQLTHIKNTYIGKNRIDLTDANGYKITQGIIDKAKQGSGFIKYIGTIMPQTGKPASKITYVKGYQKWQWAIGSGFYNKELLEYLDAKAKELKEINNQSLKKTLLISSILIILLLLIAVYISNILKRFFKDYNNKIQQEIRENRNKDVILYQQSKMASMGEMIGNIAHQWRQPLSLISTAASKIQIENDMDIGTKESHHESLEAIIKSTKYLSQTIDDFREFFNPNKVSKEVTTTEIYKKALQLTSARFTAKDIRIFDSIEEFKITTYENELIQAIINILNNSIDAFENKDYEKNLVFFNIKKIDKSSHFKLKNKDTKLYENGFIEITIKDNAGGIPKDILNKIFDAYFTTKHQSQGTGIGLYMTYQIISKHLLGHIEVINESYTYNNKEYVGAKFTIQLPIS